jgi:DNA-directed RNA polymerase subunit RPC12/RpoP
MNDEDNKFMIYGIAKEIYFKCPFCKLEVSEDDYGNMAKYLNCPRCHLKRIHKFYRFAVVCDP